MHRVRMVKYFGVTPYLVFDGDYLPSKALTEASRSKRREESRRVGLELLKAGKPSQAFQELQKAIDVTPEMARNLMEELKKADVPYVVAPYEADAQMVYLERQGLVNGIISEDSDLLVFGAKRLLTKLDQHGQCVEINRRDFCACREISLTGWTDAEFRHMAIFSGCDYLDGINNMGLKTAYRMIRKCKTPERVIRMLQFEGKFRVPENYLAAFKQAELTFLHQRVYCPDKQEIVFLTEPDPSMDVESMPYIGAHVDAELARAVAVGDVNPISKQPIVLPGMPEKRQTGKILPAFATQSKSLGKPIESFFKGHRRIPLGEMEPNCFSVEPRRQNAVVQTEVAPVVFPLPRPYIDESNRASQSSDTSRPYTTSRPHRKQTEPISRIPLNQQSSTSSGARRRTAAPTLRGVDVDDHHTRPQKKARLCEDIMLDEAVSGQPEKSKFFPPKTKKPPGSRRHESLLMSDDSVEDALRSLPDVDSWNTSNPNQAPKVLEIFQDTVQASASRSDTPVEAGHAGPDGLMNPSRTSAIAVQQSQTDAKLALSPAKTPARDALRQFVYNSGGIKAATGTRIVYGLPTPASNSQESVSKGAIPKPNTPLATPLQRIGAQALQRGGKQTSPLSEGRQTHKQPNKRHSIEKALASFPVNPSFVPLPKVDLAEVEALNRPLGSEDEIIPDSNDENELEVLGKNGTEESFQSRLDLSRFLYT